MKPSRLAYYLYCLMPLGREVDACEAGVDGRPALLHVCGEIRAAYSKVELGEFVGERAEAHLQDLAWLGPKVCRHEAVIEQIMSRTQVLPARFATLFSSLDSLDQFVLEHREAIAGFFAELGNQQEWSVKGLLDRAGALQTLSRPAADEPAASPGTRYFLERRIRAKLERDFNQRLRAFCQQTVAALGAHASGFKERKAVASGADGNETAVVLNWAFLIPPAAIEDFKAGLERFNAEGKFPGLTLALTGPWPPYSFVPGLSAGAKA